MKNETALRTYAGRPTAFRACVEQVVQQDPRSAHQGRGSVKDGADDAAAARTFTLTIDGVDVTLAMGHGLVVTGVARGGGGKNGV